MNTKMNEIDLYKYLLKFTSMAQKVKQLSWSLDQTQKRYSYPEGMREDEIEGLVKLYVAFFYDIETLYDEWGALHKEYKRETSSA